MLNILFTVDVELWPEKWDLSHRNMKKAFETDILGKTKQGDYGVGFQAKLFNEYDINATFLVEPLFSVQMGHESLQDIVEIISDENQKVELHLHTEWVDKVQPNILPGGERLNIKDFSLSEQEYLLALGIEKLKACGSGDIFAFRAGNYGSNFDTLKALKKNNIEFDTSYNETYLSSTCDLKLNEPLLQAKEIEGVCEIPITQYCDFFSKKRHVQLNSVSIEEMKELLKQAHKLNWNTFVIVLHSNELLDSKKGSHDYIVTKRLEKLCEYIAGNPDKYFTEFFGQIKKTEILNDYDETVPNTSAFASGKRIVEQAYRRMLL